MSVFKTHNLAASAQIFLCTYLTCICLPNSAHAQVHKAWPTPEVSGLSLDQRQSLRLRDHSSTKRAFTGTGAVIVGGFCTASDGWAVIEIQVQKEGAIVRGTWPNRTDTPSVQIVEACILAIDLNSGKVQHISIKDIDQKYHVDSNALIFDTNVIGLRVSRRSDLSGDDKAIENSTVKLYRCDLNSGLVSQIDGEWKRSTSSLASSVDPSEFKVAFDGKLTISKLGREESIHVGRDGVPENWTRYLSDSTDFVVASFDGKGVILLANRGSQPQIARVPFNGTFGWSLTAEDLPAKRLDKGSVKTFTPAFSSARRSATIPVVVSFNGNNKPLCDVMLVDQRDGAILKILESHLFALGDVLPVVSENGDWVSITGYCMGQSRLTTIERKEELACVELWNLESGQCLVHQNELDESIDVIGVMSDGRLICIGEKGTLKMIFPHSGFLTTTIFQLWPPEIKDTGLKQE